MSTKKTLLTVGLTALGLSSGSVAIRAEDQGTPAPPGPSPSVVASVAPAPVVLLLSDGRVLQGYLSEDRNRNEYVLKVKGGQLRFPRSQVEKVLHSISEIYQYKRDRLPERDPDERMKLAQWCLTNHLNAEAKEQLQGVLALSPTSAQAQRMIGFLQDADDRALFRDPAVMQARAEVVEEPRTPPARRAGPREFEEGVGLPTIFDLPTPLAVKRADEFNRNVHMVLQSHCARCHNERYQGSYQLIQVKNPRDLSPTILRANLEATLRLIDPENPARSELLSNGLVPHGAGQTRRPIFAGPTDPSYQRIAAWVNSLRPPRARDDATAARFGAPASAGSGGEVFAADRTARPSGGPSSPAPLPFTPMPVRPMPVAPEAPDETIPRPPGQFLPGTGSAMQPYAPKNAEFPVPYLLGGPKPKAESVPGTGRENVPTPDEIAAASGENGPPAAAREAPAKAPTKPVKVDPALLEKALMNRYTPH